MRNEQQEMNDLYADCEATWESLKGIQWRVVISRGSLVVSYGPFTGKEAGRIARQCEEEGIQFFVRGDGGPEFDWQLARDLRDFQQKEEASS